MRKKKLLAITLTAVLGIMAVEVYADDYDYYDDYDYSEDYDYSDDEGYDYYYDDDYYDYYDEEDDSSYNYDDSGDTGSSDYDSNSGSGDSYEESTIIPATPNSGGNGSNSYISTGKAGDIDWGSVFQLPSADEIAAYQNPNNSRSPYICGWLSIPADVKYSEYKVEFKADYLPEGTYCCLGNWQMDYSWLEEQGITVRTEYDGVHGYAGFQRKHGDDMEAIMSFWDIYCTDANGNETTIRPTRVYPENTSNTEEFGGEGTGAHCLVPYQWEAGKWYSMHLICTTSETTGNTVVQQWVENLETGEATLLCSYDIGVKNAWFKGQTAFFLENFYTEYAGEVRTMEVRNAQYFDIYEGWKQITSAYVGPNGGTPTYEGSYDFGAIGDRFWMITSGVGGDWYGNGTGKQTMTVNLG